MINTRDIKDIMKLVRPWKNNFYGNIDYQNGWNDCLKRLRSNENKLIRTIAAIEKEYIPKLESQNKDVE